MRTGAFMLLIVAMTTGMAACSDDDPDYNNVTPPTVAVAPNTLSGIVTSISGEAIGGATVTLSGTASSTVTTDNNGMYVFENVAAGSYALKAEATGKQPALSNLNITATGKTQHLMWNAILASNIGAEIPVSATTVSTGDITTEHLTGNTKAGIVVDAEVPAGAVEGNDVKIEITPIYTEDVSVWSRATETSTLLVGATLGCNKNDAVLTSPIKLSFNLDEELAGEVETKEYKDGQWVSVNENRVSVEDGKVVIEANEFTAYAVFLGVTFSESSNQEALVFTQDEWNNLYGSGNMTVGDATYTYKTGTEIPISATSVLDALLIEKLAQRYGTFITTQTDTYPLNVTLPIGTALTVSGTQQKLNITASALNRSASGIQYGTISIGAYTYNRMHTGGSN
ncbi:MAG: carboxypeptidase-like regulatory domain-containing protein [Bacteroidales bacterium]|nr:carboxypeptidase-like regulatory domain-containing protein [Bacteroidales bacterium]